MTDQNRNLLKAAKVGDVEAVRAALTGDENGRARLTATNNYGDTALHTAAYYGHTEVVKLLLNNGADIEAKDDDDWTPLHFAARFRHTEVAELLLQNGANIEAKESDDMTPLHNATFGRCTEVVKLLLSYGADVNAKDNSDQVPLDFANDAATAALLLAKGAKIYKRTDDGKKVVERLTELRADELMPELRGCYLKILGANMLRNALLCAVTVVANSYVADVRFAAAAIFVTAGFAEYASTYVDKEKHINKLETFGYAASAATAYYLASKFVVPNMENHKAIATVAVTLAPAMFKCLFVDGVSALKKIHDVKAVCGREA